MSDGYLLLKLEGTFRVSTCIMRKLSNVFKFWMTWSNFKC